MANGKKRCTCSHENSSGIDAQPVTAMKHLQKKPSAEHSDKKPLAVSLKTVARLVDAHRSSVRRWLRDAGINGHGK